MHSDGGSHPAQGRQSRELAKAEVIVQYQSHAFAESVSAQGDVLPSPPFLHLQIEGIEIISPLVLAGEEWLSCILRSQEAPFHVVAPSKLIPQPVLQRITHIALHVTLSLIKRNLDIRHRLVLAIPYYIRQGGEGRLRHFPSIDEARQELTLIPVDGLNHRQLTQAFHFPILIDIGLNILHLPSRKKGKLLQFLPRGSIDIQGMLSIFLQHRLIVLPSHALVILHLAELFEIWLPRSLLYILSIHHLSAAYPKQHSHHSPIR